MKTKEIWKPVTISGITGILMGAGTVYGAQKLTSDETSTTEIDGVLKETVVSDDLSFKHAFETARTELGPGAVFHWRGNIYNTYTAEEWKSMSSEEKNTFAQRVNPEVYPSDINTNQLANANVAEDSTDFSHHDIDSSQEDVSIVNNTESTVDQTSDDDVRVIGYGDVDLANGRSITVEELEINGQRVAVIDVDKDGVGDFAMSDLNHNQQADEGEIIDLHTGDVISFNDQASVDEVDVDINIMPA